MALQKDTFSVSLATGVNEKTDEKVAGPEQMAVLKDVVINKEGRLQKRYGQTVKSTTTSSGTITTGSGRTKVFSHENQLCLLNNGSLYSQFSGQDKWLFQGYAGNVGVNLTPLAGGTTFLDVVSVSGITAAITSTKIYVIEDATGAIIATATGSNFIRLVPFSSAIWLLSYSGANLQAQQVSLTTGALSVATNIRTDWAGTDSRAVSVAVTSGGLVGEKAFIAYQSTGNVKIVPMDSAGAVPALGTLDTGVAGTGVAISIEPQALSPNRLFVAVMNSSPGGVGTVQLASWTFTTSAYTSSFGFVTTLSYTNFGNYDYLYNVTLALGPSNTSYYVFTDVKSASSCSGTFTDAADGTVYYTVVDLSGSVTTAATVFGRGMMMAGVPVRDATRSTLYLPCIFYSPLQSALLLIDVLKGKQTTNTFAVAKCLSGSAGLPVSLSRLRVMSGTKYRMVNNGYLVDFDLGPTNAQSTQYIAKTTHITGGILWSYDGQSIAEHNFLIGPEMAKIWHGQAAAAVAVTTTGDASHKEVYTLDLAPAKATYTNVSAGSAPYLSLNAVSTAYYVCWRVDGAGADPAPGGKTRIRVDLLGTDSAEDVAYKTLIAITNTADFQSLGTFASAIVGYQSSGAFRITFRNSANGAVTAPSATNMAATGSLSAGSYEYCFVYKWTDKSGFVYRSLPSVPVVVSASANDAVALVVWAPAVTNKTAADVTVEIYRTQVNSTELQLLTTQAMSNSAARLAINDVAADASINANTIIYTNDGTLENFNIGACTAISAFKNRLIVTSVDDSTASFYSRTNVEGEPINFSAFNAIRLDQDGQPVTAHIQMDDKLCMWKGSSLYVTAGDGSNDLGQNESFSLPMRLPGDYGTTNPNSLILAPMGVMFQTPTKGIQVLGRNLSVQYIGAAVDDYKSNVVSSAVMTTNYENIIFSLQDSTTSLVYNYRFNRWDFFTNQQGDSACLWQNAYVRAKNNGKVYVESTNYYDVDGSNQAISMYMETIWLKVKNLQSFARIYALMLLGEYLSPHTITVQLGFDFDPTLANYETHTFNATTIIGAGGTLPDDQTYQVEVGPARQKCNAIKIKITETPGTGSQQSANFNALDFYVGLKPGLNRVKSDKSI